jgi:hypothetical protein
VDDVTQRGGAGAPWAGCGERHEELDGPNGPIRGICRFMPMAKCPMDTV